MAGEAARRIFDLFDANHDGRLDAEELRQLAKHLGTVHTVSPPQVPLEDDS